MRCKEESFNKRSPPETIYFTIECEINTVDFLIHTLDLVRTTVKYKWRRLSISEDQALRLQSRRNTTIRPEARPNRHVRGSRRSDL